MTAVSARFAGGALDVTTGQTGDVRVVDVDVPGLGRTLHLRTDEARRFAVTLIEQAARAEAPEPEDWP